MLEQLLLNGALIITRIPQVQCTWMHMQSILRASRERKTNTEILHESLVP